METNSDTFTLMKERLVTFQRADKYSLKSNPNL